MKTSLVTLTFCLTLAYANAQQVKEAEVPAIVKESFAKKYLSAKVDKWEKEGEDYEVEFYLNKIESSALFDAKGLFKELEQEIKITELPKPIIDYCTKNYVDYKLSEASKITLADDKIMFEAEMKKGKDHFDIIFDSKGNFIKKI